MKIQYASDLHLEFAKNAQFLEKNPLVPKGDILVLAGDIIPFALLSKHLSFFEKLSTQFEAVYWLPGNHEYYHYDMADKCGSFKEEIAANVFLVNNTSVVHNRVKLIFSSLWSKISLENQYFIQYQLNDFKMIKYQGHRMKVHHFNQQHEEALHFIQSELKKEKEEKIAVFTHHCPTFLNYPEAFKSSKLNEAFATELHDFIYDSPIDAWVYGHHHTNTPDFRIHKTQLLTNQLGYVEFRDTQSFDSQKCILW